MMLEQRLHRAHLLCLGLGTKSLLVSWIHCWSPAPCLQCCSCGVPMGSAVSPKLLLTVIWCPIALLGSDWVRTAPHRYVGFGGGGC